MQTLLRSGFGLITSRSYFETLKPTYVKNLLKDKGFIIIKDMNLSRDECLNLSQQYGIFEEYIDEKKKHKYSGHKYIFDVDGSQKRNAVRGRGELPIHTDGGLLKKKIDLIFLYASEIENMKFQGGTGIIDHKRAIEELPPHLRQVLEEERFETLGLEEPYYSNASSEDWLHIPVFQDLGWVRKMTLYFNYADENNASWKTRIVGFKDHETKKFFKEITKFFTNPRNCYLHFWNKGDLLLMDNRRVIHYREPFHDETKRVILRLQVFYE